jgi:hypothetical protein
MINASTWIGGALGVAIFSAIAAARTNHRLAAGAPHAQALTSGFRAALLASAIFLAVAAVIALRSRNATAAEMTGELDAGAAPVVPLAAEV